jgi:iron complex outermembrane receptor protein
MVYGLFDDVDVESETRYDKLETEYSQVTFTGEHRFGDKLKVTGLVGFSKSDFKNPIQTTVILNRENADGFSYDYRGNSNLPKMNFGFDVTDPLAYNFGAARSEIRLRPQGVTNTIRTAQLDGDYEPDRQPAPEGRRQRQELRVRAPGPWRGSTSPSCRPCRPASPWPA